MHNGFTYSTSVLMFLVLIAQIVIMAASETDRFAWMSKLRWSLWVSTFFLLGCLCVIVSFQGDYSSVNHDVCLLFKNQTSGEELPRTFVPDNL
jgi:hypothetical protein